MLDIPPISLLVPSQLSGQPSVPQGVVVLIERSPELVIRPAQPPEVRVLELPDARSHDDGEVRRLDAALDRPRGERVPRVVDPPVLDSGRPERRGPLAVTEPFDVDVAAPRRREQDRRVDPRGEGVECL